MLEQTLESLHDAVRALDNPESLSILNIDEDSLDSPTTTVEYVERCRAWTQLRNIAKSIPDLLNQSREIALVGFLGHFSSGKSSLINALLRIPIDQDPGYKREVGLHPTDTKITLISHRDHARSIRSSAYTTIDAVEVVHGPPIDFLEHATLVDTPGLGNEAAEHEAVTRFLHLCHVLVITIDGRRPFADKDKDFELLDRAFNKLHEVPKIIVVTSAEEFLTSRTASFETGWQEDQALEFWDEAIDRLRRDSRFRDHLDRFHTAPRFFVDSKEGFRVEQVKDALLPIVTDDGHRSRIRQAQGRYVIATAADALEVLRTYISTRSKNLNRLLNEAQRRADGTAIAVEELITSLQSSFASVRQRLSDARQKIPTKSFTVATIVTPQAITETQGPTLSKLEGIIRDALKRQIDGVRTPTWHRVRRHYKGRTRSWFPTKDEVEVGESLRSQADVGSVESGLTDASASCARGIHSIVNQQLTVAIASCTQHLERTSEAWEIGSSARDVESSLEDFQRKHDDSVKSFYAYVSAPASSDLLREHGFVGFDESGEQAVRVESIDALKCLGFTAISQSSEDCKERLRPLRRQRPKNLDPFPDENKQSSIKDGVFGEGYRTLVVNRVNVVSQQRVDVFLSNLSERGDRYVEDVATERARVARSKLRIWRARATVVGRFVLVVFVFSILLFAFSELAPSQFDTLVSLLPDNLGESVMVGALSTIVVLALVYIITGAKNENTRSALRSVLLEKLKGRSKRRTLTTALKTYFDKSFDRLVTDIDQMPLQIDHAIAGGVVEWLENHSESHRQTEQELANLRTTIAARCEAFDEFIRVATERLNDIPIELRETASGIKDRVIEEHMSRIRNAATSVDKVKADVQRIADITMRTH